MSKKTSEIEKRLRGLGDRAKAQALQRFFKTGPGEYGEGDRFLGIPVPVLRRLAGEYEGVEYDTVKRLLRSPIHEARLLALLILVRKYGRAGKEERETIYRIYLDHMPYINNWDLVDTSAEHIVGRHLAGRRKTPLYRLARSELLWERRIAVMATFHHIKHHDFHGTLKVARVLLHDREDLIHKAVGWMLREVGKRDPEVEETFLQEHYKEMPRTMLRYAIERFPEARRQAYLKGTI